MATVGSSDYGRQGTEHSTASQGSAMRAGHGHGRGSWSGGRARQWRLEGRGGGGGGGNGMKMNGSPPPPFYKSVGQLKSPEAQEPR